MDANEKMGLLRGRLREALIALAAAAHDASLVQSAETFATLDKAMATVAAVKTQLLTLSVIFDE